MIDFALFQKIGEILSPILSDPRIVENLKRILADPETIDLIRDALEKFPPKKEEIPDTHRAGSQVRDDISGGRDDISGGRDDIKNNQNGSSVPAPEKPSVPRRTVDPTEKIPVTTIPPNPTAELNEKNTTPYPSS